MSSPKLKIGLICGSGFDDPKILKNAKPAQINTRFGSPSGEILEGTIEGVPCALLSRHGPGHSIPPSNVNFRANIWNLKELGCTHIIASTACGGLQPYTRPGDFVVLDQFFDRTSGREHTFYGGSNPLPGVLHMPLADPFCPATRQVIIDTAKSIQDFEVHAKDDKSLDVKSSKRHLYKTGAAVPINGPRFSTRFESRLFKSWGLDVVNMTLVPEVLLAREAGLSYASVAIVTDFDSWKDDGEDVNVENVLSAFKNSVSLVVDLFIKTIKNMGGQNWDSVIQTNRCKDKHIYMGATKMPNIARSEDGTCEVPGNV